MFLVALYGLLLNEPDYLVFSLSICASFIVLLTRVISKHDDLFCPMDFVFLTVFLGVTLRSLYIIFFPNDFVTRYLMLGNPIEILIDGLLLINTGLVFLLLGYLSHKKKINIFNKLRATDDEWDFRKFKLWVLLIGLIGIFCIVYYAYALNLFGEFSTKAFTKLRFTVEGAEYRYGSLGYLRWGGELLQIGFIITLLFVLKGKIKKSYFYITCMILFGVLSLAIPVVSSSRTSILYFILLSLIVFHYQSKGLSIKKILITALVCIFILATLNALRQIQQRKLDAAEYFEGFYDPRNLYQDSIGNRHFLGVAKTSIILKSNLNTLDYWPGETFLLWIVAPIPRTIWPDKPVVRIGGDIGTKVFGQPEASGTPPGYVAELYINFGVWGVFIGMFLLGFILRLIYESIGKYVRVNGNLTLMYGCVIIPIAFTLLSQDFTATIVDLMKYSIPILIILYSINIRKSHIKGRLRAVKYY